ncbi:MAG TPA: LacI family DNA-binding transcriptional regulator [Candidatus Synoicihabitans sp.]|nr:LacI family DNA-binding transcriptional regulator [Candidatus Synoicihabitans sp.]
MSKATPPPTLQQIADRVGISRTAVSMALRNQPRISEKLKTRVRREALALGYTPNPLLAAHMAHLRRRTTPRYQATLALVLSASRTHIKKYALDLYRLYGQGLKERCDQLGYRIEEFSLVEGETGPKRLCQILKNRGIHGLVIAPVPIPGSTVDLDWDLFASVALGYSLGAPSLHRAAPDVFNNMGRILVELSARGYRRPAVALAELDDMRVNHLTLARFLAWQRVEATERPLVPPLVTTNQNAEDTLRWYRKHRPDVIISPNPRVYTWLRDARIDVPGKVGFVTPYWISQYPFLTGIDQNYGLVAAAAIDLLIGQLHRNERGVPAEPKLTLMPGRWVEGKTLRATAPTPPRKPRSMR